MLTKIFRLRFTLSILASASAAISTVLYLILIRNQTNTNEFINTYSIIGMLSAWLNNLLFFFLPYPSNKGNKKFSFVVYLLSIGGCVLLCNFIFAIHVRIEIIAFIASLSIPILFATNYGLQLRIDNYVAVYWRTILLNVFYIILAIPAFLAADAISTIYACSAILIPIAILFWLFDDFFSLSGNHLKNIRQSQSLLWRKILNPALPLLERVLWDQFLLKYYLLAPLTYNLFLFSKIISFSGTVLISYFTQKSLSGSLPISWAKRLWRGIFLINFSLLLYQYVFNKKIALEVLLVYSQGVGWALGASLLVFYEKKSRAYLFIFLFWFMDFLLRFYTAAHSTASEYSLKMLFLSFLLAFLLGFVDLFKSESSKS